MQANIDQLMQGQLGDWLQSQAATRAAAKEQAANRWTWGAAVLMPVLAFVWFGPDSVAVYRIHLTIMGCFGAGWWGWQPIARAKQAMKIGINAAIARSLGIAYDHAVEPGAEFDAAKTYGLVPAHRRARFEDRWHGTIEGHSFSLYEAHLEDRRGSGRNRRWVTVFRGTIIQMGFGRPFHSTTLLQRADKHRKWFGLGGTKDSVTFDGHRLDLVDQVHPAFEAVFSLFSDDQVEARMLVHPTYIEHLLRVEEVFGASELRTLFARGEVILAVEGKNLFESGGMDPARDRSRAEETARQFAALAGLAVAINQNARGRALGEAHVPPPLPLPSATHRPERPTANIADADFPPPRPAASFGRKGL